LATDANYLFCSSVLGESNPSPNIEKTKTTKAELTSALRDAFAYCNRAYSALTDENSHETVKAFGQERNRLGVLWFNASHNLEHYGNLETPAWEVSVSGPYDRWPTHSGFDKFYGFIGGETNQ
jgi:hypothetical protein